MIAPFYLVVLPSAPTPASSTEAGVNRKSELYLDRAHVDGEHKSSIENISDTADKMEITSDGHTANQLVTDPSSIVIDLDDHVMDNVTSADGECPAKATEPVVMSSDPQPIPSVNPGDPVYIVPDDPVRSIPVFYAQLIGIKGSDASWVNDTEPPPEVSLRLGLAYIACVCVYVCVLNVCT